jgi:3-methyladenine DNA glycosylase AlkD
MGQVETLFRETVARLDAAADLAWAEGQRRFFKHEVDTRGVRQADLAPVIRDVARAVKPWPLPDRNALMKLFWETGKLEDGALVCHVYRRFAKSCTAREFMLFERWIDRYVRNWAHCDGVSSWLVAACIANEPELRFRLREWAKSRNRWMRRAAAVSLLQEAKKGRQLDFIFEIAGVLLPERDDMIEKGVGWLLKETYPAYPRETVAFLMSPAGRRASRLTLRYSAEKMTPADRRSALATNTPLCKGSSKESPTTTKY